MYINPDKNFRTVPDMVTRTIVGLEREVICGNARFPAGKITKNLPAGKILAKNHLLQPVILRECGICRRYNYEKIYRRGKILAKNHLLQPK